jgi:hypothetical protein
VTAELSLQPSVQRLRLAILEQNRPGSVEGLLAHHVLRTDPFSSFEWQVGITQDWMANHFKPTTLDHVAALGYFAWGFPSANYGTQLADGLARITERDAFKGEHLSIAHSHSRLLGLLLGALALDSLGIQALKWCQAVLEQLQARGEMSFDPLLPYLFFRAFNKKMSVAVSSGASLYERAFADWMIRQQMQDGEWSSAQLLANRNQLLFQAATDLRFDSAPQAAFVLAAVNATLFAALGSSLAEPRHVASALKNFESAMRRWRWDKAELQRPVRWPIVQEREVQDILWLVLRSYFPDVVDEDALPKLGHSSYRADFGIPSLRLIVEAKFANSKDDFKKIEKEVQEDCIPYLRDLRYESLLIFIYDDSASVQEHEITRAALLEIPGVIDAVIVSRPSQLPPKSSAQQ